MLLESGGEEVSAVNAAANLAVVSNAVFTGANTAFQSNVVITNSATSTNSVAMYVTGPTLTISSNTIHSAAGGGGVSGAAVSVANNDARVPASFKASKASKSPTNVI